MKREQLVLNTLVFAKQIEQGFTQGMLLKEASKLDFSKVEIRREYIGDFIKELPEMKVLSNELGLELYYSVPDEVFYQGQLNEKLQNYLDEGQVIGIKKIKWNIGDFRGFTPEIIAEFKALETYGIEINIENDQTQQSGSITAIQLFMEAVAKAQLDIGYVYDLGNWRFVGKNETEAAEKLASYVRYIHVKDVMYLTEAPLVTELDAGVIDWRHILSLLPQDVPVAIEYPTEDNQQLVDAQASLLKWQGGKV